LYQQQGQLHIFYLPHNDFSNQIVLIVQLSLNW